MNVECDMQGRAYLPRRLRMGLTDERRKSDAAGKFGNGSFGWVTGLSSRKREGETATLLGRDSDQRF